MCCTGSKPTTASHVVSAVQMYMQIFEVFTNSQVIYVEYSLISE